MNRRLYFVISFFLLVVLAHAEQRNDDRGSDVVSKEAVQDQHVALFGRLFKLKRQEQKDALQRLLNMKQQEKQLKLLELIVKNIIEVLLKGRIQIEMSGYIPGDLFPADEVLRDAVSSLIENTVFLGDLVLYLPDSTAKLLRNTEWSNIFNWSLGFCRGVPFLDRATEMMLHLVAQELNLVERDPNYMNPYSIANQKKRVPEGETPEKKKKKKKLSKGPALGGARIQNEL